jgi:hypothetical protein
MEPIRIESTKFGNVTTIYGSPAAKKKAKAKPKTKRVRAKAKAKRT